jgi:CRISPR/Cas system-associated exonuclease Cas4 (RecB family)
MAATDTKIEAQQITCSAGRGVMGVEECYQCALEGQNTCGYGYTLLKAIYRDNLRTGIHVSDITGCLRRAWFERERKSKAPQKPHEHLALMLGSAVHEYAEHEDEHVETEIPLEAFGILGTADLYFPETGLLMDIKTTRWLTPSKLPYGSHEMQLNIYAAMLREMGKEITKLAVQYIDMSGPTKCRSCKLPVQMDMDGALVCPKCGREPNNAHLRTMIYEVRMTPHEEIVQLINERREAIENAVWFGVPPEKETSFLCNYCNFREVCS